jgi:membrane protein DedA with SNARE-associated domain
VHSETFGFLRIIGMAAMVVGLVALVLRISGVFAVLPGGTGILTAGCGLGLMVATDILQANPWILWLMLVGIIGFGVAEWYGRDKLVALIKRKASE